MSFKDFYGVIKMPKGVLVGLICQFTIMPFLGFSLATLFNFPAEIAAGVVLIGSSPSGLASNVMAYLANITQTDYQIDTNGIHHQMATKVTDNVYDIWGNITNNSVEVKDDSDKVVHTTTLTNDFGTSLFQLQKGRIVSSTSNKIPENGETITETSNFQYYDGSDLCLDS